jgi:hypothetical protein
MTDWHMAKVPEYMRNPSVFSRQNKIGKRGEKWVKSYLRQLPETISIRDVSRDPVWQKKDIDIIWNYRDERGESLAVTIDVKTIASYTAFYFETIADIEKKKPGKFLSSEADYFYYVFPEENSLYIVPLVPAREWFENVKEQYPSKKNARGTKWGFVNSESEGSVVPREDVIRNVKGVKVIHDFYKPGIFKRLFSLFGRK